MSAPVRQLTVVGDEYVSASGSDDIDISLGTDQIMQRYLVRRIFREAEFSIKEHDGTVNVGFITGFDERCIQISTTPAHDADEPRSVLIFWPVRKIEETGRKLDDVDPAYRVKIRSYSHALRAQCERVLSGKRPRPAPIEQRSDLQLN